ncbi:MAG: hypothetical protein KF878_38310, partial [Planctomycetes bacterium]|nr:hypothetical protein [Planctomycetota bacterium]
APRALGAKVDLAPGGLPLPALLTAAAALEEVTLAPGERPAAWLPVGPVTRALVRVDAIGLPRPDGQAGGAFRLTRGRTGQAVRIENGTALPLDRVLAITDRGVYGLDALPPGHAYERDLDLLVPPVPFARWRVMTVEDEDERAWRALVTAALAGRDLRGRLVLVGRGPPVARVEGGVAEEQPARPLVVITASDETSGR